MIYDGGELRLTARNSFGKCDRWTIPGAGGNTVRVKKGGLFSFVKDPSSHSANSVCILMLEGGRVAFNEALGTDMNPASYGLLQIMSQLKVLKVPGEKSPAIISNHTDAAIAKYQALAVNKIYNTTFTVENVTEDDNADLILDTPLMNNRSNPATDPVTGRLIKKGAGTLLLLDQTSALTVDMIIEEGTVRLDYHPGVVASGKNEFGVDKGTFTLLGDMTKPERKIIVKDTGCLQLMERNHFCAYSYGADGNNNIQTELVITNGGSLVLSPTRLGGTCFGPIAFIDGTIEFDTSRALPDSENWGWGAFAVRGTMRVGGTQPFKMNAVGKNCWQILYRNKETQFDVADITKDAAADFITDLPFVVPMDKGCWTDETTGTTASYGFQKRGAGTMVVNGDVGGTFNYGMTGEADVAAGTLEVNGGIHSASLVTVEEGAFLSGTGKVSHVSLTAGAGFRQKAGTENPLRIIGNLTVDENPIIRIDNPDGLDRKATRAALFTVSGTITGLANLKNATVYLDNEEQPASLWRLEEKNGVYSLSPHVGTLVLIK